MVEIGGEFVLRILENTNIKGGVTINIIFYSTECPKCKILKQKLNQKQIIYKECNDIEIMKEKGFLSVPVLEVNGVIMDFNNTIKWLKEK